MRPLSALRPAPRSTRLIALVLILVGLLIAPAIAAAADSYSPYADVDYPTNVYWGDTHVHSSWSPDAGGAGNEKLSPIDAFRFAKGEPVVAHNGETIQLRRPLDFLLVSDHSEYLGLYPMLEEGYAPLIATQTGARWLELLKDGRRSRIGGEFALSLAAGRDIIGDRSFVPLVWKRAVDNAEQMNDPGRFTAFIGYEWTSMPGAANLHRNVLFRDGAERTRDLTPFSAVESQDPELLWEYLADYETRTGGRVMSIPHNSNLSAGRMFEKTRFDGSAMTRAYAASRTRFERVVEATQIKGDSETAPFLSPDDEFADFGTWDFGAGMNPRGAHEDAMYEGEYVRGALGNGLVLAKQLGTNPFALGLIGSTDAHTSLATADDADFWGKFSGNEPYAGRADDPWATLDLPPEMLQQMAPAGAGASEMPPEMPPGMMTWALVSSGYAAVWAHENTRESLFDALDRREAYATTGPRIVLRVFGGWDFVGEDADRPNVAAVGYAKGVPMGAELPAASAPGKAPGFLVSALRDPEGANLDRVQIVKMSLDNASGTYRERIFDVAVADGRKIGADGRARKPVGNTVDVEKATYLNSIGASALTTVWRDPEFDPTTRAVYYVRVLEIPTPRWTTYDAAKFGTKRPEQAPATLQQRAYSSPIWYRP